MKMTNTAVAIICVLVSILVTSDAYNLNNWMGDVSDSMPLGQIAIPGTHDSGSYSVPNDVGECHDWNIKEQLANGIRFLDIRISNNYASDDFELRHGFTKLGSFKRLVMNYVRDHLNTYPSETILMSIKDEQDPLDVYRLQRDFINNNDYKFYQYTVTSSTQLRDVRGKIVLFKRYSGGQVGIVWNNYDMTIQDVYNLDVECKDTFLGTICSSLVGLDYPKKARKVVEFLNQAAQGFGTRFWVNFASANWNGGWIGNNAEVSNKAVKNYFNSHPYTAVGCIIPMDYASRTSGVIDAIIHGNFNKRNVPHTVLTSSDNDGKWGEWGNPAFCPDNQFVFGYRERSEGEQGSGDDTALNDIELRCAQRGNIGSYTTIHSRYTSWGDFRGYKYCSGGDNPVIGFNMLIESEQGSGDDTAANKVDLYCKNGGYISAPTGTSFGSWTSVLKCPSGQAVVGIATRVEGDQHDGDDTALNGVRMICVAY